MSTPLVRIAVDAGIADALASMASHAIHHLLIEDRGRVVAVVSDRDLVRALPGGPERREHEERRRRPVFQLAHYHLVTVEVTATVEEAAALMLEASVSSLPVVDADDAMVGIITSRDLLRSLAARSEKTRTAS